MSGKTKNVITTYFHDNAPILILQLIIFSVCVAIGALTVTLLDETQKNELYTYVNGFFAANKININWLELFNKLFINYLIMVLLLWFLGAAVLGIPLIIGLIGYIGFSVGFTTGFIFDLFADWRGLLILAATIIPQILLVLPGVLVLSTSGIKFSLYLLNGGFHKRSQKSEVKLKFVFHSLISVITLLVCVLGAFIEAIFLPLLINII